MKYALAAVLIAGTAGCAWFGGDADEDRATGRSERVDRLAERQDGLKVGFERHEGMDDPTGDTAVDPVSGEVVRQETTYAKTWKGLTYYFASEDNLEAFEDDPSAYVTEDGYLKRKDDARREAEVK